LHKAMPRLHKAMPRLRSSLSTRAPT
jgi:hypothetical protein